MPKLTTSTITNAMYGGTQLSAVYKGATPIWTATVEKLNSLVLSNTNYRRAPSNGGCTRGTRYDLAFQGIHNLDDPGRQYCCQYFNKLNSQWEPLSADTYWENDAATQPGVPFDFRCTWIYSCSPSGTPGRVQGRMRFRLSDGTVGEWKLSPPALYTSDEEEPEVFIDDPPNESEMFDG